MFGKKTLGIGYSLAISELILAPVTPSNTARGGGIIHPIMKSIAGSFDSDPEKGTQSRIGKYLALVNYHSNPITSAMFITATAPNPLIVDLIAKATNSDIHLSWGTWAVAMLVPGLAAMFLMPLVLYLFFPPEIKETPNASQFAKDKLQELGPMNRGEKIMLAIFAILLLLWAGIPAMIFGKAYAVNPTTTAFLGLSLLLLSGVLTWQDVLGWRGNPAASGLYVCPLHLRQHHRPHHRHAQRLLCRRPGSGRTPHALRPAAGLLFQHHDDPYPLRHRHFARDFRFRLHHLGRMVESRLHHERGQPRRLRGHRRRLVESDGLLVNPKRYTGNVEA